MSAVFADIRPIGYGAPASLAVIVCQDFFLNLFQDAVHCYKYFSNSMSNLKSHSKQTLKYKTQQARWHKHLGPRQIFEISIQRRSDSEFHAK